MATLGQYKGIDINPGDDASVQAQIRAIDTPTTAKPKVTADTPLSTPQSYLSSYDTGTSYKNAQDYNKQSTLSKSEESRYRKGVMSQYQGEIDAAKTAYSRLLAEQQQVGVGRLGESTAIQARRGLQGSSFGTGMTEDVRKVNLNAQGQVLSSQASAIANIMSRAKKAAQDEIDYQRAAKKGGLKEYQDAKKSQGERKQVIVVDVAKNLLTQGIDYSALSQQDQAALKGMGISQQDIINSYLEQKSTQEKAEAEAQAKAEREGAFSLSEGQARYDSKGNLVAAKGKTYAPTSGGGSGIGGGLAGNVSPAAKNILELMNKNGGTVNDYVTGSSREAQNLRNEVYSALTGQGGATDKTKSLATEAKAVVDSMIANNDYKKFGYSSIIPGARRTTGYGDMQQRAGQISAILAKDNLGLLKGAMSDKDLAFIEAMSGGVDTSGTISEAFAKERIASIQKKFADKIAEYEMTSQAPQSTITVGDDGQEYEIID